MNISLYEIEKACGGRLVLQGADACGEQTVCAVELDSRKIKTQGLFVATVGERVDGHRFIPSVFEQGAVCVITEKLPEQVEAEQGVPAAGWGSYILVDSSFQALKDIAEYYRSTLNIPVIGITGSVGKTSTKEFIAGVLGEKYKVLKTEGNFNNEIGLPLTLLRIRKEHEAAVVEMGISDFGEMHRLSKIARPNICVITNIGQCHLENLKTRDGILKAKTEIFDFMAENGEVCLNGEDDKLCTVTQVKGKPVHFFGLGGNPAEEVYASDIVSKGLLGSEATMHMGADKAFLVEVPLPGVHMVMNAAAAACVAGLLGLTQEQIAEGIRKVTALGGRSNLIRLEDYTLIDDCYNANPVSMKAAIDLLGMADTVQAAILGDMFELGDNSDAMHSEVGEYAAKAGIHHIICVGENSRHMYQTALENASKEQKVSWYESRPQFLEVLKQDWKSVLPQGGTILMKASHGMGFAELVEYLKNR